MFGFVKKIKSALTRTGSLLGGKIATLFSSGKVDEETLDQLEELLYQADLGVQMATELTEEIRQLYKKNRNASVNDVTDHLKQTLKERLAGLSPAIVRTAPPTVILVIGVNGNGKTTSVAKLAHTFSKQKEHVILGAADTFRAAATEQLDKWSKQLGVEIVKHQAGADPSAVVFDAVTAAVFRGADKVIIDTAGRLHTKTNLMEELAKIRRVSQKVVADGPHETLLVLDATTGQNAIDQAKAFHSFTPITGLILTKLDGTARGGIVIAIQQQLQIPVKFIGVGEGIDDLQPFNSEEFIDSLFS